MSYTRQQLEDWLKTIEVKSGKVLDCGGSQNPLSKSRLKIFEPDDYKILDLEQPHECKQVPDLVEDIQNINWEEYNKDWQGFFDVVFCLEVFEYIFNPIQALKNINSFLKKDGILYITFTFMYGCHKPEGTDFLRYTPFGAEKLLKETNFKVLEHRYRMATSDRLVQFYVKEKMKILKNFDHNIIGSLIKAQKL